MDWLDLLAVQGTLKSLLQHHSSKASVLRHSAFFTVQLSHPYMTTGKTIALTRRTLVGKVMSLLLNMLSRVVITFLPRRKRLLISWLQSPSSVILCVKSLSCVWLFATPWTVAYQAPPSMGSSRQESWSGLSFPSPGDLPNPGIEPGSPAFQADALTSEPPRSHLSPNPPSRYFPKQAEKPHSPGMIKVIPNNDTFWFDEIHFDLIWFSFFKLGRYSKAGGMFKLLLAAYLA